MTGNKCLLDTSIVIHAFKDNKIADQLDNFSEIFVSSIAVGELYYCACRSSNPEKHLDQIKQFLQNCTMLNVDAITASLYGSIKAKLKDKGRPIPENDIWIAAISIQFSLPLFTTDKHFKEVDGITTV